jgi:flagellin-like protein
MKLKQLFADDDAVSPVIGVILMVAITVILAAVIASFVLGLGDQNNPAPTADFTFDYDSTAGDLTITHGDGDAIEASNLYVRGQDLIGSGNPGSWSGEDDGGTVKAGHSWDITTIQSDSYEANVVWEDPDSDSTSTLSTDEGPDA